MGVVTRLWSRQWRWLTITCLWIAVAALAHWGFAAIRPRISIWDRIYMTPDVFKQGISGDLAAQDWRIQLARFLGPLIFATTFFAAVAAIFRDQIARARLRFARGHIVVAGLGDKGSRLAASLRDEGQRVVAIERDPANPNIAPLRRRGVTVLDGDAADVEVLREANIAGADALVAICDADGTNAEVLDAARRHLTAGGTARTGAPVRCSVHLRDPQLSRLLRTRELAGAGTALRFDFFNIYQRGARQWLIEAAPFKPDALGRPPHLMVIGLDELGQAIVVTAGQRWLDVAGRQSPPLAVTVVDADAGARVEAMRLQHPALVGLVRFDSVDLDGARPSHDAVDAFNTVLRSGTVTAVFVAIDDDTAALSTGLDVRQRLGSSPARIHVRTRLDTGLALLVGGEPDGVRPVTIDSFGLLDRTCTADIVSGGTNEQVARALHADYFVRARREGISGPLVTTWEELPAEARESNRLAADALVGALSAAGCYLNPLYGWDGSGFAFTDDEVETLARLEHDRWTDERRRTGWTYGPTRDDSAKTNPSLVAWTDLPEEVKRFNREAVHERAPMLARAGFEIVRIDKA
jgi:hypothetical protein